MSVYVVDTECANIASMLSALHRLGAEASLGVDGARIARASQVVVPGVGTFAAAMNRLRELGLVEPLKSRLAEGRSTLCVCVGFQLLFETSEESPNTFGLGWLQGQVRRFPETVRVPQFGWNIIEPSDGAMLFEKGYMYFANSYYAAEVPNSMPHVQAHHGVRFVAGIEKGAVLGCQFHPELSSKNGLSLLKRWLGRSMGAPC